ncbi:hypothetical protein LCGC14_0874470 [marine sediment metagenome]|uniref:Uncharacterized protein n=1 Tax=marine sediment metagenome TaxID=412755 RepID=A0A0F9P3S4_9ZZZZ
MNDENLNVPKFSEREVRMIETCRTLAANDPVGASDLAMIIAKLSSLLIGGELEDATEPDADSP